MEPVKLLTSPGPKLRGDLTSLPKTSEVPSQLEVPTATLLHCNIGEKSADWQASTAG